MRYSDSGTASAVQKRCASTIAASMLTVFVIDVPSARFLWNHHGARHRPKRVVP